MLGSSGTDPSDFLLTKLLELDDAGSVIDLASLPTELTIEATVDGDDYKMLPVELVQFSYDDTHEYSDAISPYSLAGEAIDGVTLPMEFQVGKTHFLTTTVSFWNDETVSRTITFSVVDSSAPTAKPTVFPSLAPSVAPSPIPSTAVTTVAPTQEESTFETFYLVNAGVDDDTLFKANKNKTFALYNIEILDAGPYDAEYFKTHRWAGTCRARKDVCVCLLFCLTTTLTFSLFS